MPVWNVLAIPWDENVLSSDDVMKETKLNNAKAALANIDGVTVNDAWVSSCTLSLALLKKEAHDKCREALRTVGFVLDDGTEPDGIAGKEFRITNRES